MERKKLYKAKKNWVIGLATGLAIMALGTNIAYADNNTSNEPSNEPVVTTQQANASAQQTANQQEQINVQPENTIGMSSNVASNPIGSYNKDNVGYANPNSEEQYYDALQENAHHLSHQSSYNYPEKLLNKFARKDDVLKKYGVPNVYEYSNGSENPYENVKIKQITTIPSVDADKIHYLNNGVSNSIYFFNTKDNPNYNKINSLSQALSYSDYELLTDYYSQSRNTDLYGRFYDGDEVIVTPKKVLSTRDLNALYKVAFKNRPIITFDGLVNGHRITSLLQSSISSFNDGWNLTFDNGWRGYTFMDGKQIAFTKILRENGKSFSWKNVVLKYFAQSLAYNKNVAKSSGQKTPYMLVGRNHLPITDILTSRTLNRLENPFNVSPTEFIYTNNGVYTIVNGAMGGYNPILVQMPMAFLDSEYRPSNIKSVNVEYRNQKGEIIKSFKVETNNKSSIDISKYNLAVELDHTLKLKNGAAVYVVNHILNKKNILTDYTKIVTFNVDTTKYTTIYLIDKTGKDAPKNKIVKEIHLKGVVDITKDLKALDNYIPDGFSVIPQSDSAIQYDPDKWFAKVYITKSDKDGNPTNTDPNAYNHYETNENVNVEDQNTDFEADGLEDNIVDTVADTLGLTKQEAVSFIMKHSVKFGYLYHKINKGGFHEEEASELGSDSVSIIKDIVHAKFENSQTPAELSEIKSLSWDKVDDAGDIAKDAADTVNGVFEDYDETLAAESKFDPQNDKSTKKARKAAFLSQRKGELSHINSATSTIKDGILAYIGGKVPEWAIACLSAILGAILLFSTKFIWAGTEAEKAARLYRIKAKKKFQSHPFKELFNRFKKNKL